MSVARGKTMSRRLFLATFGLVVVSPLLCAAEPASELTRKINESIAARQRATTAVILPAVGAAATYLLAGGVLFGLGGGDPLRGPAFALSQFASPGVYLVLLLGVLAALAFRMGTSPHRTSSRGPIG